MNHKLRFVKNKSTPQRVWRKAEETGRLYGGGGAGISTTKSRRLQKEANRDSKPARAPDLKIFLFVCLFDL